MATAKPWNPMEDAYKNQNFNKYTQGPGAELDDNLQPAAMASASGAAKSEIRYQICLKNVPADMSEKALMNLCSSYAKVTGINRSPKTPYIFVGFSTLNDMERTLEGFRKEKPQGIMADIAKHTASSLATGGSSGGSGGSGFQQESLSNGRKNDRERDRHSDSGGSSQPDMSKRTIKGPFANPERPRQFAERKPFVTEEDYRNSRLKHTDPDRQCLVESDMHDRDRKSNSQQEKENQQGGRKMHTGRAYYKDSKETIDNLQKLSAASKGSYNSEQDAFIKFSAQFEADADQIQYCNLCKNIADKICQRCGDYYCSLECQRKDWNRHRMFCFPMPELVAPVRVSQSRPPTSPQYEIPTQTPKLNDSFESNRKNPVSHQNQENSRAGGQNYRNQRNNEQDGRNQRNSDQEGRNQNQNMEDRNRNRGNYRDNNGPANFHADKTNQKKDSSFEKKKDSSFENKTQHKRSDHGSDHGRNKPNQSAAESVVSTVKAAPVVAAAAPKSPAQPPKIESAPYPKSGSMVAITAFIKPNLVYIRSMAAEDNLEYVKTVNLVNNEAKVAKTMSRMPKKGDYAIADFQGDGYFRVCVINPDNADKIMIAYIDFGNVDYKKLSELKEISDELIVLKRQALRVTLKDVENFEPTEKIKEYMESFVDAVGKDLKLTYTGDGEPVRGALDAELIEISTNVSLNKTINELRVITPPTIMDDPVYSKEIKYKTLPKSENVQLVVLDTSLIQTGSISCIHETDLAELDKMTQQFAEYVKNAKGPYTPRQQEICLVQYDDDVWYRAECIEVVGDQNPTVLFMDFGNLTTAHISKIRKYPRELIVPCVTLTCLIACMPDEISTGLANRLKELIPVNETIVVNKVDVVDEQTNLIQLDDVVKTLKEEKLI